MTRLLRVAVLVVVGALAGCDAAPATQAPGASGEPIGAHSVDVMPATVLLRGVGETRKLEAKSTGTGSSSTVHWSTSDDGIVAVAEDGTVTARALGSAQVTADVGGVRSAPVLVAVTQVADGVTPVDDSAILSDPIDTDPDGAPSADATYEVVVAGDPPAVGDRLVGTGEKALAGEVVAVSSAAEGTRLTMRLVPLRELLPGLDLEETIDLSAAPVAVRPEVAALFDVTRAGNRFDFVPKPNFDQLVSMRSGGPVQMASAGGGPLFAATGTRAVPPFEECEGSLPSLPITLSEAPSLSIELNPTLDVAWSADELQHWVVRANPTVTAKMGIALTSGFEATYECKLELFTLQVPVAGALSLFIAGLVPIGLGFKVGGSFTLATFGVGGEAKASATAALGVDCASGDCQLVNSLDNYDVKFEPKNDAPSIGDVRFKPSFEVFGYAKAQIGNRFLRRLRFEAVTAKLGAKLAADWAPRAIQIQDTQYASSFGLSAELSASAGVGLGEVAKMLGVEISFVDLKVSASLERSPSGTVSPSKASYETGETVDVRVTLAQDGLRLFGLVYDVDSIILVHHSGGSDEVVAKVEANDGQHEFDLSFQARGPVNASQLYAFVVTKVAPFEFFGLELAPGEQPQATPKPSVPAAGGNWHGSLSVQGAAPIEFDVDLVTEEHPSLTRSFGEITFDSFNLGGVPYLRATGTIEIEIRREADPEVYLEIRNGPQMAPCNVRFQGLGAINAEATRIDVPVNGTSSCAGRAPATLVLTKH